MRSILLLFFCVLTLLSCEKENNLVLSKGEFDPDYRIRLQEPVQDKNFYLLSLLQRDAEARAILKGNSVLDRLAQKYMLAFRSAKTNCKGNVACVDQLLQIGDDEIADAAKALGELAASPELKALVDQHLRPSGMFIRYDSLPNAELLQYAWRDAALAMNRILRVYGLGEAPRYPKIDRVSYEVGSEAYQKLVDSNLNSVPEESLGLFFEPTLAYAMGLLNINKRDEAGRYEPIQEGHNKATIDHLPNIDWDSYAYALILVLGDSPNSPGDLPNISIGGMARADHGVRLWKEGKAPLLVFSGGHVNPFQTPYSEAVEMKKYVMEKYGIPENRILIDPHARHTTTNLRNVARLVFRYGIPAGKKAIVTTSSKHSAYTTSPTFHDRCLNELGYLPAQLLDRLNDIDVEFLPKKVSLQADAMDPLDP